MKNKTLSLLGLVLVLLSVSHNIQAEKKKLSPWMAVTKVVDGDTFWVDDGSPKGKKVRLIGVDTPETVHPQKKVEYYGKEASDYTKSLLQGQRVRLEFDVDSLDRYGRLLAYVYLKKGKFLNAELVRRGYAQVATFPPNVKYAEYFQKLQRQAQRRKLGLWGENKNSANQQTAIQSANPLASPAERTFDTLAINGAWCWFADPRAIYYQGDKEQTYFSWVNTEGDIVVASYNHQNAEFIQHVVWEKFQSDDHANPTLFIREDGRLIIFMAAHFGKSIKRFISTNPEDISSWGEMYEFAHTVTYPYPFQLGKDSILLFFRGGSSWKPHMVLSTDNGVTFGAQQEIITSAGKRPYMRYCQGEDGSIHMAATTGHPRDVSDNKIFYCRFNDNRFYRADGSLIKDFAQGPPDVTQMDEVYDGVTCGKGWIWDIALEAESQFPVMVYASFPTDTDHRYHYARWNGSHWENTQLTQAGTWFPQTPAGTVEPEPNYSGGIILDYDNPSVVYLSKQVNGVFEIFKYTTADHGQTWQSEALTENTPKGLLNIRPIVPRHHKQGFFDVIWMRGQYEFYDKKRYNTSLVFPKMQ